MSTSWTVKSDYWVRMSKQLDWYIASYIATLLDIINTLGYFTSLKPTWPLQLKFASCGYDLLKEMNNIETILDSLTIVATYVSFENIQ